MRPNQRSDFQTGTQEPFLLEKYQARLIHDGFRNVLNKLRNYYSEAAIEKINRKWPDNIHKTKSGKMQPSIFISYAWEKKIQKWVKKVLSKDLKLLGFKVYFDLDNMRYGMRFENFESAIYCCTHVAVIATPVYKQRYDQFVKNPAKKSGVADEMKMIISRIEQQGAIGNIIPIVVKGIEVDLDGKVILNTHGEEQFIGGFNYIPSPFSDRFAADFCDENYYENFFHLLKTLYQIPDSNHHFLNKNKKEFLKQVRKIRQMTLLDNSIQYYIDRIQSEKKMKRENLNLELENWIRGNELPKKSVPKILDSRTEKEKLEDCFFSSAEKGDVVSAEKLLKDGVDPNAQDILGDTAIHIATEAGQENFAKYLILIPAIDLKKQNKDKRTSLHFSVMSGNSKLTEEYLKKDPALINISDNFGNTALFYVEKEPVLKVLLKNKAHVNHQNNKGDTPLHNAIIHGNNEIAKDLVKLSDIRVDLPNKLNKTPKEEARIRGLSDVLLEMDEKGTKKEKITGKNDAIKTQFSSAKLEKKETKVVSSEFSERLKKFESSSGQVSSKDSSKKTSTTKTTQVLSSEKNNVLDRINQFENKDRNHENKEISERDHVRTYNTNNIFEERRKLVSDRITSCSIAPKEQAELQRAYSFPDNQKTSHNDLFLEGENFLLSENYTKAIELFSQAICLSPNTITYYYKRAYCYYCQGNYENTIVDCSIIISLSKEDSYGYYLRAAAYFQQQNYLEAAKDYDEAIKLPGEYSQYALSEKEDLEKKFCSYWKDKNSNLSVPEIKEKNEALRSFVIQENVQGVWDLIMDGANPFQLTENFDSPFLRMKENSNNVFLNITNILSSKKITSTMQIASRKISRLEQHSNPTFFGQSEERSKSSKGKKKGWSSKGSDYSPDYYKESPSCSVM